MTAPSLSAPAPVPASARRPLRVLLVEDNADDAALVLRSLRRGGYEPDWRRVDTAPALAEALADGEWDLILSDFSMPQLDAFRALEAARGQAAHVPFIIISGSIGEETAVAAMRAGASDYVMKANLARLAPAVERELREAAERGERARTRKALREAQAQFQVVFHEYPDVMLVLDLDGTVLHANRAVTGKLGYGEEELVGQPFAALWAAREHAVAGAVLQGARRGAASHSGRFRRRDGTLCPMDLQAGKVPWGRTEAVVATLRDASERHQAQQRLADEKEQLAVTLRSMGDGPLTADARGRIVLVNGAAERLTGWRQDEAAGRPLADVLPLFCGADDERCDDRLLEGIRTGETVEMGRQVQMRARDGRRYAVALKAAPIHGHDRHNGGLVVVFRDTTAEQKLEDDLQKASKLESVSLLAGGIAHDFNNILTAILGHLALAKLAPPPVPPVLDAIEKACLYATDLTRQLLTFSKDQQPVRRPEDIAAVVREGVEFALHGSPLRSQFDLPAGLPRVELDRAQFHQVINNLVLNAVQATAGHGVLEVTLRPAEVTDDAPVADLPPGRYVRLTVRDHGPGIAPATLARVFDPYFTTKPEGSGLGLATSYSILRKHGGLIQVESEPGRGTAFHLHLPAVAEAAAEPAARPPGSAAATATGAKGRRVLFMDDEAILQELISAMLEYLGCAVTCAAHGEEAIARYLAARDAGRGFDLVIVDLTVPGGMGGREAVARLRALDPGVRAIVSSGYSNDPIMADFRAHGFCAAIAKPYQLAELEQVLEEALRTVVP